MKEINTKDYQDIVGGGKIPSKLSPTGYITVPDWVADLYYSVWKKQPK